MTSKLEFGLYPNEIEGDEIETSCIQTKSYVLYYEVLFMFMNTSGLEPISLILSLCVTAMAINAHLILILYSLKVPF